MLTKRLATFAGALALAGALIASASTAAAAAAALSGAGSTLVAPIEAEWAAAWAQSTGNPQPTYQPVGSGAGLKDIAAGLVDFGGSDAPLSASTTPCNGCFQIPWALTATGVSWNVPGIRHLRLTGPVLARIYLGQITNWDNPAITRLNRGERFPNLTITPIHRADGSGDSYAFTDYLSDVSPQFKRQVGRATKPAFPTGPGGQGNGGMVTVLQQTRGGIAYIAVSYLIAHRLPAAAIQNQAGNFEVPNLRNIANAASVGHEAANGEIHIVDPPRRARIAYPISTFTYCILQPTDPLGNGALLRSFVRYALGPGQAFGPALDFVPLPANIRAADERAADRIH
ncbi:MAG TPA: phosphate ABC transporter substrate-binding protein PstS [Solirubrobacteraceae bacterium]|nr:phosphate ABC transporter substrate-binding protein PstS [Solirubrobacteraceae bacterium]